MGSDSFFRPTNLAGQTQAGHPINQDQHGRGNVSKVTIRESDYGAISGAFDFAGSVLADVLDFAEDSRESSDDLAGSVLAASGIQANQQSAGSVSDFIDGDGGELTAFDGPVVKVGGWALALAVLYILAPHFIKRLKI